MSDTTTISENYQRTVSNIIEAAPEVDSQFEKVNNASFSACDSNTIIENTPQMELVHDNGGRVVGYDYYLTLKEKPDTDAMQMNSNVDTGEYGSATGGGGSTRGGGAGRYTGHRDSLQGLKGGAVDGNGNSVNCVAGYISPEWLAVSTLAKMGKNTASQAAEFAANVSNNYKENHNDQMVNVDGNDATRVLYGVGQDGTATMYVPDEVIAAMAMELKDEGAFDTGDEMGTNEHWGTASQRQYFNYSFYYPPIKVANTIHFEKYQSATQYGTMDYVCSGNCYMTCLIGTGNRAVFVILSESAFTVSCTITSNSGYGERTWTNTYNSTGVTPTASGNLTGHAFFYYTENVNIQYMTVCEPSTNANNSFSTYNVLYLASDIYNFTYGGTVTGGQAVPGITTQDDATVPVDAITGADPHVVAQNLENNYPSVMGSPIYVTVLDDDCVERTTTYYSVPFSYSPTNVDINVPITGGLQINPSFNPDVSIELPDINMNNYTEQITYQLQGSGAGRDVVVNVNNQIETLPATIPDTGSGVTPAWYPDDTTPSTVMWKVYNPSPAQLRAFGEWLWTGTGIVEQFRRIVQSPMDAVLCLHKIYKTPTRGGSATIVCGNLDSEVSSPTVSDQYVKFDCGAVWLTEYFGNVFDYPPYTEVSIYLPFIGIVRLDGNDVMRALIGVSYTVDVYTGACIAEIMVNRDGVGGVLYQFNGNAAVEYPINGMNYNSAIMGAMGVSTGVISGIATGNPLPLISSLGSAMMQTRENIQRSGSFSGNAGAMGAKKPYLIITRPQPEIASDYTDYGGYGANATVEIGSCSGFIRAKHVDLSIGEAYKNELEEIENLLKSGIYV